MYLKELELCDFRSFKHATVSLEPELTILVGANNSGKSNTIDAIRLLTRPLSHRRDLFCQPTDIRFGLPDKLEVSATFTELSNAQKGRLLSACTDPSMESVCFGLSYKEEPQAYISRPNIWAGQRGRIPEVGSQDAIRHVYLPALRDAKQALSLIHI